MISYCVACYRPIYAVQLIEELIEKTSVPYEILLWLNVEDAALERFLSKKQAQGHPVRVLGRTPENIGMVAYFELFEASRFELVAQIDDDVICISPRIAEIAQELFLRFPALGMLATDVWQDEFTNGARPPMEQYAAVAPEYGLYDGPIDGWFAIYRKSSLELCQYIERLRYIYIGGNMQHMLRATGRQALLCTKMKVFHVSGAAYCSYFGMLQFEIDKFDGVNQPAMSQAYRQADPAGFPMEVLEQRVREVRAVLAFSP